MVSRKLPPHLKRLIKNIKKGKHPITGKSLKKPKKNFAFTITDSKGKVLRKGKI